VLVDAKNKSGWSSYNSLQDRYTRRFSHGLTALLSYTWSKEMDDMTVFDPLPN